uniref:(northern house mosquito) hypothetical protein n=1 Tax=Culex pipiens TaxID=7175 RepID=A0A8D8C9G6_CULPI
MKFILTVFLVHLVWTFGTQNIWYIEPTVNRNSNGATVSYSLNGTSWLLDLTGDTLREVPIVYNKNGVISEDTIMVLNCAMQITDHLPIDKIIENSNNYSRSTDVKANLTLCNDKTKWMLTEGSHSYVFTVFNSADQNDLAVPKELVYGLGAVSFLLLLLSSCLVYCKCASPSASGMEDYHIVDICLTGCCKF